ncbi:MAG: hypothetical protein RLZZ196_336 [Bacteroidota bacterium]|jgi:hypothetical protein
MVEDYIQDKVRRDIVKEIRNLELPNDWKPQLVIDYIIRKIDKK